MRLLLTTTLAVVASITSASSPLAAQSAPIVGTWNVEWEFGRRTIDGESTVIRAKGTLKVDTSGDSLVATLTPSSRSDEQPIRSVPMLMGGRASATGAVFTQITEVTLNVNGEERRQRSVGTWTLTVNGSALTGSLQRLIEGAEMEMPSSTVTGSRAP